MIASLYHNSKKKSILPDFYANKNKGAFLYVNPIFFTMARLTEGISYHRIKHITAWQLTAAAQRLALAQLVKAISRLDVTQTWGTGRTSSSDGQRFKFTRKVLQRTYSHKLSDYAIEFYAFVADN